MTRPVFTPEECQELATFLELDAASSEEDVAHAWAGNYWHNHMLRFKDGTPVDGVSVPAEKLIAVAKHFESEMCSR